MGVVFSRLGALRGSSWYLFGAPGGSLGLPFRGLAVALGVHFGGQGVPLDAFGAQAVPRTALLSYGRSILGDVGAQRVPKRFSKWS